MIQLSDIQLFNVNYLLTFLTIKIVIYVYKKENG
jgi:hypothetical protein